MYSPHAEQDDDQNDLTEATLEAEQEQERLEAGQEQTPSAPASEAQLPPEARGETNGGPLGCCLGIVVGLLLSLSIAIVSRLYATPLFGLLHGNLSITVRIIMVLVGIGLAVAFGYLGWKIGKRAFREYELSPQQKQRLERLEKAQRRKQKQKRRFIMP